MRTVQEVFNLAISLNYYKNTGVAKYMCLSVNTMHAHTIVTLSELLRVEEEIEKYIGSSVTLKLALASCELPYQFEDLLHIYLNWADRPNLIKKEE
jgi:hypothetical protein